MPKGLTIYSRVCREFGIPFYLVKGISDYANFSFLKNRGKGDGHRYLSIATSSALCLYLLCQPEFRQKIVEKSTARRPGTKLLQNCLYSNSGMICRYVDGVLRKCINPAKTAIGEKDGTVGWFSRTFEDMLPAVFSKYLNQHIQNIDISQVYLTTFFPYSAKDVINFLGRDPIIKNELREKAEKLLILDRHQNTKEIIDILKELKSSLAYSYGHFKTLNDVCLQNKIAVSKYGKGQPQIARILIFPEITPVTRENIIDDPLNALFPILCGFDVPTYFTTSGMLIHQMEACSADATFLDRTQFSKNHEGTTTSPFGDLVTLRFFESSHTLLISGIPCSAITDSTIPPCTRRLSNLYYSWQGWCNGKEMNTYFSLFPLKELQKKHNLDDN